MSDPVTDFTEQRIEGWAADLTALPAVPSVKEALDDLKRVIWYPQNPDPAEAVRSAELALLAAIVSARDAQITAIVSEALDTSGLDLDLIREWANQLPEGTRYSRSVGQLDPYVTKYLLARSFVALVTLLDQRRTHGD